MNWWRREETEPLQLGLGREARTKPTAQEKPDGAWKWLFGFRKRKRTWVDGVAAALLGIAMMLVEDAWPDLLDFWTYTAIVLASTAVWELARREVQVRWRQRAKERMTAAERMAAYETERLTATEPPA